jgi:hypothetical protein
MVREGVGHSQTGPGIRARRGKTYDEAQRAHGKPLARRVAFRDIYFNLGAVYAVLGQNSEALESYRYGRLLDPGSTDLPPTMAAPGQTLWRHSRSVLRTHVSPSSSLKCLRLS